RPLWPPPGSSPCPVSALTADRAPNRVRIVPLRHRSETPQKPPEVFDVPSRTRRDAPLYAPPQATRGRKSPRWAAPRDPERDWSPTETTRRTCDEGPDLRSLTIPLTCDRFETVHCPMLSFQLGLFRRTVPASIPLA